MREALLELIRGFRFEVTFHVSTGASGEEQEEASELRAELERAPVGFTVET